LARRDAQAIASAHAAAMALQQSVELSIGASAACTRMNRLIVACRDDARALGRTAAVVGDPERRKRLLAQSRRRRAFIEELSGEVTSAGGTPAAFGSIFAALGSSVAFLRDAVAGAHQGDAYAGCARTAQRSQKAYARAAAQGLPSRLIPLVDAQAREISESCDELTRLRDQH
jgi:uncharacterized protein (TIGR02284 family)